MTISERNKMNEAVFNLEAVRDSLIKRKMTDQYYHLQTIIIDLHSILDLDSSKWYKSLEGGDKNDSG